MMRLSRNYNRIVGLYNLSASVTTKMEVNIITLGYYGHSIYDILLHYLN